MGKSRDNERYRWFNFQKPPSPDRVKKMPERDWFHSEVQTPNEDDPSWRRLSLNAPAHQEWRGKVGTFIAENLGADISRPWFIEDFPEGYSLWAKQRKSGRTRGRWDKLLYGYGGRTTFRSPEEFGYHACWLWDTTYFTTGKCECKLCTGRKQSEIEEIWKGIPGIWVKPRPATYSPDEQLDPEEPPAMDPEDVRPGLVRWVTSERHLLGDTSPRVHVDRSNDLTTLLAYRGGEVVWVAIPPLAPPEGSPTIRLWPAEVRNAVSGSSMVARSVKQEQKYSVLLLVANTIHNPTESKMLPWRAYAPSTEVQTRFRSADLPVPLDQGLTALKNFQPVPSNKPVASQPSTARLINQSPQVPRTFQNALAPLAVANSIGDIRSQQYALLHMWQENSPDGIRSLYQGMWLGPQLIWVGDYVVLCITRKDLEDEGTTEIRQPSSHVVDTKLVARIVSIERSSRATFPFFACDLFEISDRPDKRYESMADNLQYAAPSPPNGHQFRKINPKDMFACFAFDTIVYRYRPDVFNSAIPELDELNWMLVRDRYEAVRVSEPEARGDWYGRWSRRLEREAHQEEDTNMDMIT